MLHKSRRTVARAEQIAWLEPEKQEPAIGEHQETTCRSEVIDPWPLEDGDYADDPFPFDESVQAQLAFGDGARVSRFGAIGMDRELAEKPDDENPPGDDAVAHRWTHAGASSLKAKFSLAYRRGRRGRLRNVE